MRVRVKRLFLCIVALHIVGVTYYMSLSSNINANDDTEGLTIRHFGSLPFSVVSTVNRSHIKPNSNVTIKSKIKNICRNLRLPEIKKLNDKWHRVNEANSSYVFSAYFDESGTGVLDIVGARSSYHDGSICQLWKRDPVTGRMTMKEATARATNLPEGHGRRFLSVIFSCTVPKDHVPDYVSMVTKKCQIALHVMKVHKIKTLPYQRKFTVCVTPFNFRYGRAYELVEWIELNRIMGAGRFTFYNYSTANNVKKVLDYYNKLGLVEVVTWDLPMGVDTWPRTGNPIEIHYFGQVAALNECWRRNKEHSEYIVYIDLDEYIVPHEKDVLTWDAMLKNQPDAPSFLFQNVFFRKEWDDSTLTFTDIEKAKKYKLITLTKTVREDYTFPYNMRSKYIISSKYAKSVGIHNLPSGQKPHRVHHDIATLHHYRNWENYDDKKARHTDMTMISKYKDDLITNVEKVWSDLKDVEMDIPIEE